MCIFIMQSVQFQSCGFTPVTKNGQLVSAPSRWISCILGDICVMKDNKLPTYEDAMKFYQWTRHKIKNDTNKQVEPKYKDLESVVMKEIYEIWSKTSIPTLSQKRAEQKFKKYHEYCRSLLKCRPHLVNKKSEQFIGRGRLLFDISTCKCEDMEACSCPEPRKVPERDRRFLVDQRTKRNMVIGGDGTYVIDEAAKPTGKTVKKAKKT